MIPTVLLGTAKIPNDGGEMTLTERDNEFSIKLKGVHGDLMSSRMYSSELALAELGCAHIQGYEKTSGSNVKYQSRTDTNVGDEDCTHFCIPGLPDHWNRLMYNYLISL